MRFIWFWTFWHWSKESFRNGALLREPLQGIGGHWDEWFRHEASESDLRAIEDAGRTESAQRQFIAWLHLHWAREANWGGNRLITRFVLGQLAQVAPFKDWCVFGDYRESYGVGGIPAIVLAEASAGQAEDVRPVEGLTLPAGHGSKTVPEGFHTNPAELDLPRQAAGSLLVGRGLWTLLALWLVGGERPYSRVTRWMLTVGWLTVAGLILFLIAGPDPGVHLTWLVASLFGLWAMLVGTAVVVAACQCLSARRQGERWNTRLEQSQLRLRMNGGLTVKGGSAGLPFCLNILLSLYRAASPSTCRSWIWRQIFRGMRADGESWAATGALNADGSLKPVILEPKVRACLERSSIKHLLTPRQPDAHPRAIGKLMNATASTGPVERSISMAVGAPKLGFAAERRSLALHPCRHVAQALMALGGLNSRWQAAFGLAAVVISGVMGWALPDLRGILAPPAAPEVVAPSSPSPYHLWVSLDTDRPDDFQVVFESSYWSNRRAPVARYSGANASVRSEILLHRLGGRDSSDGEDGTIWVERRRHFLNREFAPGERVGRYTLSYLNRLAHE